VADTSNDRIQKSRPLSIHDGDELGLKRI